MLGSSSLFRLVRAASTAAYPLFWGIAPGNNPLYSLGCKKESWRILFDPIGFFGGKVLSHRKEGRDEL